MQPPLVYNPHHKRAWKNAHTALKALSSMVTDFDADPSNTSHVNNDKATQAYILVQDIEKELNERRTVHNKLSAKQRIAMRDAS